jgi:hypothetical protein
MSDDELEKLRDGVQDLFEEFVKVGISVTAFQKLLVQKGYLTDAEVARVAGEIFAETKTELARLHAAIRREPPKAVQ